jgi:hypothetical protein
MTVCKILLISGVLYLDPSCQEGSSSQAIPLVKEKASSSVLLAGAVALSASTK